jgi:phosphate transport system permease protein
MQLEKKESTMDKVNVGLAKRYRREKRFRRLGLGAIILSISFLCLLFTTIVANGWSAFYKTEVLLDIHFDAEQFDVDALSAADYDALVRTSLKNFFPDVQGRSDLRKLYQLVSTGAAFTLQDIVANDTSIIGSTRKIWLPADDEVDMFLKGYIPRDVPESDRRLTDKQVDWIDQLAAGDRLERKFNTTFFTAGDSKEPELAGIRGAVVGSMFTLIITLMLSFPILRNLHPAISGQILLR